MYQQFYGLKERPFSLLPDPDFLFLSARHQRALDTLELAIHNQSGFCVISGEIGAGKTTLIRELLNRLDADVTVGLVSNTHPSFGELLQWVTAAFGLPLDTSDKLELHKRFLDFVVAQYAQNRHTLLIVDEAQNLSAEALEELRMLSNINNDKHFVLQVILVGQQQLHDRLREPGLVQFAQRIALDYHLEALDTQDTATYISHRLRHAGGQEDLFSEEACRAVARHTHGIPRLINRLCDRVLVFGFAGHYERVEADLVEEAADHELPGSLHGTAGTVSAASPPGHSDIPSDTDSDSVPPDPKPLQPGPVDRETPEPAPADDSVPVESSPLGISRTVQPPGDKHEATLATIRSAGEICARDEQRLVRIEKKQRPARALNAPTVDLHRLVVDSLREDRLMPRHRKKAGRGPGRAVSIVVIAGMVTGGWMTRDRWLEPVSAGFRQSVAEAMEAGRGVVEAARARLNASAGWPETNESVAVPRKPQTWTEPVRVVPRETPPEEKARK